MKIDSTFGKKTPRFINFWFYVLHNVIFISIKQSEDFFLRPEKEKIVILSENQFKRVPEMLVNWKCH